MSQIRNVCSLHAVYASGTEVIDRTDYLLYHADQPRAERASRALACGRQVPSSSSLLVALLANLRAAGPSRLHLRCHEKDRDGNPRPEQSLWVRWSYSPHPFGVPHTRTWPSGPVVIVASGASSLVGCRRGSLFGTVNIHYLWYER